VPSAEYATLTKELAKATIEGTLGTDRGIDMFYGPNPFEPITEPATSLVVHVPLDPTVAATISRVSGVIASAGMHALRLYRGKLYDTSDGWATWREVQPPPSGALSDLADAMCTDAGCLVGPWARIGW